jgi:hypothetical protein
LESLRRLSNRLAGSEKMLGLEKGKKPFDPFFKSKFKESKTIEVIEKEAPKVGSVVEGVLPKKRGRPRKGWGEGGEFIGERRRRFGVKKVAQIKSKKKKT